MELQRKLRARGYAETDVDPLLDGLADVGLLSEERLAEAYVAERIRKGFGPMRIRQELRHKGLPNSLIESHLARSTREWLDSLSAAHNKRYGSNLTDDVKERARRARFLAHRGFPSGLVAGFLQGEDEF